MGDVGPKSYIVINMKKIIAIIIYKIEGSRQSKVHCSTPASQNHHEYIGMMSFDTIIECIIRTPKCFMTCVKT